MQLNARPGTGKTDSAREQKMNMFGRKFSTGIHAWDLWSCNSCYVLARLKLEVKARLHQGSP